MILPSVLSTKPKRNPNRGKRELYASRQETNAFQILRREGAEFILAPPGPADPGHRVLRQAGPDSGLQNTGTSIQQFTFYVLI